MSPLTRRGFLGSAGAAAAGAAVGAGGISLASADAAEGATALPFYGARQAGVVTPQQDRIQFAAFDVTAGSRGELRDLLRSWSAAAARMTAGRPVGPVGGEPLAPPADTGEAVDLGPSRLTLTFGFGPSLFDADRPFGLSDARPDALTELPALPGEELDPARCGGDLAVQACADDPQVAFHAVRNLARIARGAAALRWSQAGFRHARNLFGFKDGTVNAPGDYLWASSGGWMRGGTYLVARRIRMLVESWDRASLQDQEQTIGRAKGGGARLSPAPATAHARMAAPEQNDGARILRRSYSYEDGVEPRLGELEAGLFFVAFQGDPRTGFIPIQRRLGMRDALAEYVVHTGSALFAIPPGARRDGYVGETLLG